MFPLNDREATLTSFLNLSFKATRERKRGPTFYSDCKPSSPFMRFLNPSDRPTHDKQERGDGGNKKKKKREKEIEKARRKERERERKRERKKIEMSYKVPILKREPALPRSTPDTWRFLSDWYLMWKVSSTALNPVQFVQILWWNLSWL